MSRDAVDVDLERLAGGVLRWSNRVRSGVPDGFIVSPRISAVATCVEGADLGTRGQDPYQLLVLWTCGIRVRLGVTGRA